MKMLTKKLRIIKSQIPNSGKGVITTVPISKGQYIIEYTGRYILAKNKSDIPVSNVNIYRLDNGIYIDGTGHIGARINDADGIVKHQGCENNCKFIEQKGTQKVFVVASRDIKAGEELFVGYSEAYWLTIVKNS